jgi:hypothetical protein
MPAVAMATPAVVGSSRRNPLQAPGLRRALQETAAFRQVMSGLVVRFRHLAPIFACPRPNVEISRTTSNDKFLVAFLNLTFVRRDCSIWDTNVKFTPLAKRAKNLGDR